MKSKLFDRNLLIIYVVQFFFSLTDLAISMNFEREKIEKIYSNSGVVIVN